MLQKGCTDLLFVMPRIQRQQVLGLFPLLFIRFPLEAFVCTLPLEGFGLLFLHFLFFFFLFFFFFLPKGSSSGSLGSPCRLLH